MSSNGQPGIVAASRETRALYWCVRRELWENRSIYLAPLIFGALFLFGFAISLVHLPQHMRAASVLDPMKQHAAVVMPYNFVAGLTLLTAFVAGVFYCLDALHGERRDRSILFWKSLPVSDRATLLSKTSIPLLVLPPFVFTIIVITQVIMLLLSSLVLLGDAPLLVMLWTNVKIVQSSIALLYAVIVIALWHAPIYGWLLLVSSWARRAAFLWAVLPVFGLIIFERIAFGTKFFYMIFGDRMAGWLTYGFAMSAKGSVALNPLSALTPGRFLSTPALWLGLAFAAAFLTAAVRLRRNREPI